MTWYPTDLSVCNHRSASPSDKINRTSRVYREFHRFSLCLYIPGHPVRNRHRRSAIRCHSVQAPASHSSFLQYQNQDLIFFCFTFPRVQNKVSTETRITVLSTWCDAISCVVYSDRLAGVPLLGSLAPVRALRWIDGGGGVLHDVSGEPTQGVSAAKQSWSMPQILT